MNLNEYDQTIIFEADRIALSDANIFDMLCDEMDISDEHLQEIRSRLEKHMETA
jgi:hypothetical protein